MHRSRSNLLAIAATIAFAVTEPGSVSLKTTSRKLAILALGLGTPRPVFTPMCV